MIKHFEITVYGRVQGVGYRYSASIKAKSLNLQGWVKNQPDGSVRAVVQGEESSCRAFIEWCKKGPEFSRVDKTETLESALIDIKGFSVHY